MTKINNMRTHPMATSMGYPTRYSRNRTKAKWITPAWMKSDRKKRYHWFGFSGSLSVKPHTSERHATSLHSS